MVISQKIPRPRIIKFSLQITQAYWYLKFVSNPPEAKKLIMFHDCSVSSVLAMEIL